MKTKLPTAQLLPSGQYRCQVMVGGKRVSVVDADPNMAQAKAVALKARIIEENSALVDRKAGNITLENAIKSYIADRKNVLSPSTINGYNEILRNRFKTLMPKMVRNIDASDIQAAVNIDAKAVGYKTLKNALMLIVPAIAQYKEIEIKRIKLPQRKKVEHPYLDEEGIMELFEAISGNVAEIPILLALWLGMRRSEMWYFNSGAARNGRRLDPPSRRGLLAPSAARGGDAYAYILRAVSVLPCNHRHYWPVLSGKKEVTAPAPQPSGYFVTNS